jgi:hypothetical protein
LTLFVGFDIQKGKDMMLIDGVKYTTEDVNMMSDYLKACEGFWDAGNWPSSDVVYWIGRRFPGGPQRFLAMGKVDTSKPFVGWICYTSQNAFSGSWELTFNTSVKEAVAAYRDYCEGVGTDDCTMTLYYTHKAHEGRMVADALQFESFGCPFDYPDRIIERGPRGGVRIENT